MGLKSGSRDAGLDDSDGEESAGSQDSTQTSESQVRTESASASTEQTHEEDPEEPVIEHNPSHAGKSPTENQQTSEPESVAGQQTMSSIPYKLRRDKVNEGRAGPVLPPRESHRGRRRSPGYARRASRRRRLQVRLPGGLNGRRAAESGTRRRGPPGMGVRSRLALSEVIHYRRHPGARCLIVQRSLLHGHPYRRR